MFTHKEQVYGHSLVVKTDQGAIVTIGFDNGEPDIVDVDGWEFGAGDEVLHVLNVIIKDVTWKLSMLKLEAYMVFDEIFAEVEEEQANESRMEKEHSSPY